MATAEPARRPNVRNSRRRPFAWMKRLANLKNSVPVPASSEKKNSLWAINVPSQCNVPASAASHPESSSTGLPASPIVPTALSVVHAQSHRSFASDESSGIPNQPAKSNKSTAPTVATNPDTIHSDTGHSKAGTSTTGYGVLSSVDGGANSTFSSPNHSQQSLATTLTTVQSTTPSGVVPNPTGHIFPPNPAFLSQNTQYSLPYNLSPAPAIPPHLAPSLSNSYSGATAGNMLTDNASILTLASSSKRRRRNSLDTDASVRAIAPSSLFGNSRESLPLSHLSNNIDTSSAGPIMPTAIQT